MDELDPSVLEHVTLPDRIQGGWEINGYRIADVSTEDEPNRSGGRRARWSHDIIWRLESGKYALYRSSQSHVYHSDPTTCLTRAGAMSGERVRADDLPDGAIACWVCEPPYPDELRPRDWVRYEWPRQSLAVCEEPHQVIDQLTTSTRYSGAQVSGVPDNTLKLIGQARDNDSYFATADQPVRRIG